MFADRSLFKGIVYGVCAGLCWGVIFLGPQLTPGLSGLEFAVLRFLCYGAVSAVLLMPRWRRVCAHLSMADWKSLFWLSLIGNLIYYTLVGTGVQLVGIATTSLIVGLIPVIVTLAGRHDADAVSLHKLVPSLCCAVGGVMLISWHALINGDRPDTLATIAGISCAVGALVTWSWYAVSNARRLVQVASVSAHDWALLTGVMTGAQSLLLAAPVLGLQAATHGSAQWLHFLLVAGGVAILSSVVGGACWNQASRLLPLALSGQVLVIETLAALVFGFLWEQRLPDSYETAAIALLVTGVVWCLNCHRNPGYSAAM
ncbi:MULTISPECIES: DMT family transporter [Pseudomonas]|uniref:DMT family transporter n=1 Tax=Pseudomonas TaxID=286 RepID=UPI001AEA793E|nr:MULTISPECIES: DMT family transporter [unclassified Pseudomonas]MBP1124739.1 drug/metabolite transporter (DMT)-like permease [Pseudomonas sp. PvP025]MDQ0398599.1 drug/metabolite transporter (DMT)-like permease [Pseudomonas sp. PvP006]